MCGCFIPGIFVLFKSPWPGLTLFIAQVVKGLKVVFRARNHKIFWSVVRLFGVVAFWKLSFYRPV
jgi:hypothetical protein